MLGHFVNDCKSVGSSTFFQTFSQFPNSDETLCKTGERSQFLPLPITKLKRVNMWIHYWYIILYENKPSNQWIIVHLIFLNHKLLLANQWDINYLRILKCNHLNFTTLRTIRIVWFPKVGLGHSQPNFISQVKTKELLGNFGSGILLWSNMLMEFILK